jgi:hypothetical protein
VSSSDVSGELDRLLARARTALSPSGKDAERNWARTLARVEVARAGGELPHAPRRPASGALNRIPSFMLGLLSGVGIAAVAAGVAYQAGVRAGFERAGDASAPIEAAQRVVPALTPSPLPAADTSAASRQASHEVTAKPSSSARPLPSVVSNQAPRQNTLEEELRMLRRVERAQRQGNARLALSLLDDLDESVPHGVLGEERFAARTVALCTLGYGSREALQSAFVARHPGSVYAARVAEACAASDAGNETGR